MLKRLASMALLSVFLPLCGFAQNPRLTFEVASVKPNNTRSGSSVSGGNQGDRFYSTNVTLTQLVRSAYGVQEFQISGQPGWSDSDRFDIEAKMEKGAKPEDWQPMLQSLL